MPDGPALTLRALEVRIDQLERRNILADDLHRTLQGNDMSTAAAVLKLTEAISDPKTGLIVELDRFRREVENDRQAFRAWVRGATLVLSIVFGVVTIVAPWIRLLLEGLTGVRVPG